MAKKKTAESLGRLQAEVLRHVVEHAPVLVAEVARHFASRSGKARTTILTVMEKLREKDFLVRGRQGGRYVYEPKRPASDVLNGIVKQCVDETLEGSVSPFVNYLSESGDLTGEELLELKSLVQRLESDRKSNDLHFHNRKTLCDWASWNGSQLASFSGSVVLYC